MAKRRGGYLGGSTVIGPNSPLMGGKPRKPRPAPMPPAKSGWNDVDALFRELGGKVDTPEKKLPPMRHLVDPHRFTGKPLIPEAIAQDDYRVSIEGITAGRIMRQHRPGLRHVWAWSVTGPMLAEANLTSWGEADTIEEARQEFRAAFDGWLQWALSRNRDAVWHY